ncbi:MAG: sulfite exporter TauE/SafE family protein [Bacteroidota bacterium]
MLLMEFYAAFLLGLTGSLHCVGMCAPLMMATNERGVADFAAYQTGRIATYVVLGYLLGALGWGIGMLQLQAWFAVACGIMIGAIAILGLSPESWLMRWPLYARLQLNIRHFIAKTAGKGRWARFGVGCCNGLLPCGLVYLAIIGAANTNGPLNGALFMLSFGLGTLPLLMGALFAGRRLLRVSKPAYRKLTTVFTLLAAILFIWRGWHAGLPNEFHQFQDMVFPVMCNGH